MAGNVRFELSSASPDELGFTGSYSNGQRGSYPSATLDRSGSFREGSESRIFGSGASTPRASASPVGDVAPLTQCLLLEPVTIVDHKYTRMGELRRLLGISLGSSAEDNAFGAAHSKPLPPVATEDLKRFRASVLETSSKARHRIKRFNESLLRLNKYEALNPKKQQRNEMLLSERSGGSNFLKMGMQIQRNPSDLGTQRLEDRTKNIVLNKRVRSSVAELRADGRSNTIQRQPLVGKDRDILRDGSEGSDPAEEKVRRLPAGGEGWDRKMKRKRSMGTVFSRPTDNDGEVKRVMHHKFNNETGQQSCDAQGHRSGSLNVTGGTNKLDVTSSPANSSTRTFSRNEPDKVSLTRDFAAGINKERVVAKANNKVNILDENHVASPSPLIKGKASRGPRTGSVTAVNTSPNFSRASVALDGWEQPQSIKVNSVGGTTNRKRQIPTGSASPPMAQWVGQRPQKSSRTRRTNVVSPISNHDEVQMSSDGGAASDFTARVTSVGINGPIIAKDVTNGTTPVRVKHEIVSSPARLSEGEESGAVENREGKAKEKGVVSIGGEERPLNQNVVPSVLLTKKNKMTVKEEISDGIRRQGRTGRATSSSRASISPMREKLENPASTKPLRSTRPASEKSGSKSGRPPLKKLSERKALTRLGQTPIGGSPDFTGESDDDREELLAAANSACNSSYFFCSSPFWKKMELVFTPICSEDSTYLKQKLKLVEEHRESLSDVFGLGNDNSGFLMHEEKVQSQLVSEEFERNLPDQGHLNKLERTLDLVDQSRENGSLCSNLKGRNKVTPLYQRVLSALIVEDESEEFEEINGGRNISFQHSGDGSPGDGYFPMDFESGNRDGIELSYDSMLGFQNHHQPSDGFACNGSATMSRATSFRNHFCNNDVVKGGHGFMPTKTGMFPLNSESNNGKPATHAIVSGISPLDCQYEQLCLDDRILIELQSIGLCPETVPDLADGEEEAIDQDIHELQKRVDQQVGKMKAKFNKIIKAIEEGKEREERSLEQVAMDKLVELAYKKQLATRGSSASKFGVPKVPKQTALAFTRRTLARCRKFEDTGKSCFSEPSLRDVVFAAPPRGNVAESLSCPVDYRGSGSFPCRAQRQDLNDNKFGRGAVNAFGSISQSCDQDFAKTGPILNRGKKKEVLLDDVSGNATFRATSSLGNTLLGGAKGKRSERDTTGRNSMTKAGRASQNKIKGDHRTKSKPKQKAAQLSTPGDGPMKKYKETGSNKRREVGVTSHGYSPLDSFKESRETNMNTDLPELDSIEFGGHQDLSSLFDGIPESDLAGLEIPMDCLEIPMDGLEIPMDDLSELNMF